MKLLAPALVMFRLLSGVPTEAAPAATNGDSLLVNQTENRAIVKVTEACGTDYFRDAGSKLLRLVSPIVCRLIEWRARVTQRRTLAMLNDHMLKDIGLSRVDVEREISKPFWRG